MSSFRMDMHVHTKNVSSCGKVGARDLVSMYKASGYDAVVITDHYYRGYFDGLGDLGWAAKIDRFLAGYREARDVGQKIGLAVLLGMELRFQDSDNDYLVYGVTEDFLKENPSLFTMGLERFHRFSRAQNILIYQAHPFRPGMTAANPDWLDGAEVYNGNARHDSRDGLAYQFALRHRLAMVSGSDFHQPEDLGRGGLVLAAEVDSNAALVAVLKEQCQLKLLGLNQVAI